MSLPPQVIRVKRKRVEESPVSILKLEDGIKRPRSGTNWVYQRRDPAALISSPPSRDAKPVIHISKPDDHAPPEKKQKQGPQQEPAQTPATRPIARSKSPSRIASASASAEKQLAAPGLIPPLRTFHMLRRDLAPAVCSNKRKSSGAIFVEKNRSAARQKERRKTRRSRRSRNDAQDSTVLGQKYGQGVTQKSLKRPGATSRTRTAPKELLSHAPLPESLMHRHNEDLDKIAEDMNKWVLNEIGTNLEDMTQQSRHHGGQPKFRPKAPRRRYQDRHPGQGSAPNAELNTSVGSSYTSSCEDDSSEDDSSGYDSNNSQGEGDEDDSSEWVYDEYDRVPANSMEYEPQPGKVGVLVFNEEADHVRFYGSNEDEEDVLPDDEEDENAENHYTADYPEDEVDSDDEYDRQPYAYRNGNASDDEEYDNDEFDSGSDDMTFEGDLDDDSNMQRIHDFMRRNKASRY